MDFFDEDEDYFGANEYLIPGETRDGKFIAFYEEGLFSSTNPHPEYISLEQNRKHEHQSPTKHYCECYGYSSHPFSVKHETTCCKKPAVHVVSDPLERSHKAATGHCIPSHMTTEMPCSVLSQHLDSSLFPNEFPVNLLSEMLQLQDFSELDPQLAELEKKDTVQRKQENNRKKSRLLLKQQGKSCGSMNSRDFMELYKIRRPSGSKDRHTKVATSRGPRDRRMRLSVETAIKFFDVQDRLGFDQPGKAIEWLILKSRSAIDQLPAISSSPLDISSGRRTSLDSLLPSLDRHTDSTREDFITNTEENIGGVDSLSPSLSTEPSIVQQHYWSRRKIKNPRKSNTKTAALKTPRRWRHDTSLKEIRSKARERARERTRERTKHKLITSGNTTSASQDMSRTRAVELEAFNLHETTISASSPTICKESMNASGKHLYCDASTMKFGLLEKSLIRVFHHDGSLLPAQDSVKEIAGNLHLSGNSNPSFSDSQSQIQSSVQTVAQPEDRRIQSTGSFSGLCSSKFSLTSCLFPQTVTSMNGDFQSKGSDVSVDYSLLQPPSIRACTQPSVSASNHEHRSIIL